MLSEGVLVWSLEGDRDFYRRWGKEVAVSVFVLLIPENSAEMAPSCSFLLTSCAKMSSHAKEISKN